MALTSDDVAAISRLLDERLAAHTLALEQSRSAGDATSRARVLDEQRRNDRRRLFWRAVFIVFLIVLGIGAWVVVHVYHAIHAQIVASEGAVEQLQQQLSEAKIAYQQELAQNKQWQQDRAQAIANTHYDSAQTQAGFDANLMAKTFALLNQAQKLKTKAKTSTGDDEADLDSQLQGMSDVSDSVTNILMQMMLHETDPAHDSPAQSAAVNDSHPHSQAPADQSTPLQAAPNTAQNAPAPVTQAPAPAPAPADGATPLKP